MRKYLALAAVLAVVYGGQMAYGQGWGKGGKKAQLAVEGASIVVNEDTSTLAFGDPVTVSVVVPPLESWEYPLVTVGCYRDLDGDGVTSLDPNSADVLYLQLDLPETVFPLGGGSSLWWELPGPATCQAKLWSYPGFHDGVITELASTEPFEVGG